MTQTIEKDKNTLSNCPLCKLEDAESCGVTRRGQIFVHCRRCDLIFKPASEHLSLDLEKRRYQAHLNTVTDAGYVKFLMQLIEPTFAYSDSLSALDYGCGPSPVLVEILRKQNLRAEGYDPLFFPCAELLEKSWDLIFCSEVWEHFRKPKEEIAKLRALLNPSGILSVMTQFHSGPEHFAQWWYADDVTHVSFYSPKTLKFIAENFNLEILEIKNPVIIFRIS